ncbi:MAG: hypothetical protein AB1744_10885, partial [Candidatus Zixiibacteriota bacterium]
LLLSTMIIERSRDQVRYLIVAAELVSAGRTGWDKPTPYERQSTRLLRQLVSARPTMISSERSRWMRRHKAAAYAVLG